MTAPTMQDIHTGIVPIGTNEPQDVRDYAALVMISPIVWLFSALMAATSWADRGRDAQDILAAAIFGTIALAATLAFALSVNAWRAQEGQAQIAAREHIATILPPLNEMTGVQFTVDSIRQVRRDGRAMVDTPNGPAYLNLEPINEGTPHRTIGLLATVPDTTKDLT